LNVASHLFGGTVSKNIFDNTGFLHPNVAPPVERVAAIDHSTAPNRFHFILVWVLQRPLFWQQGHRSSYKQIY